jgi:hypothetical protein
MGSVHDGGVFALPPHRRRALSGPQREWLPFGRLGPRRRARVGARRNLTAAIFLSVFSGAPAPSTATSLAQSRSTSQPTSWKLHRR